MMLHKSLLLLLSAAATLPHVSAQPGQIGEQFDPDFVDFPDDGIDYLGCFRDLKAADLNGDGVVKSNEYLAFIQIYGIRICHTTDTLSLEQRAAFNTLACGCQAKEGGVDNCCILQNAQIETAGALDSKRTPAQRADLIRTCRITDGVIYEPRGCDPTVLRPDQPPPFAAAALPSNALLAPPATASGLTDGQLAGIIVGAILGFLLLMLCCCCCVMRRRKKREEEEEEEMTKAAAVGENGEPAPEQYPGNTVDPRDAVAAMGPAAVAAAMAPTDGESEEEDVEGGRGAGTIDDEEEEEEVQKGRGSAKLPPEEDPNAIPRWGGPRLPPDDPNQDGIRLNPIDPEEKEEDPDWDYPGRQIDYPKDKDEMSAGEVEHYEPDGGVYIPEREGKAPVTWKNKWERPEEEDPDEHDNRKHRIQAGLGEGEVWNKLGEGEETERESGAPGGDAFDWVVQSALGILGKSDEAGHLADDKSKAM